MMSRFAACIVIPIYNHKDAIGATVAGLAVHRLPIFVVDDGSDEPTRQVLAEIVQQYAAQLALVRLPVNGGKGAAVMAGLRAARDAGYTHALQIDADGQHDAADVPRFIDAAHAEPDAVILGLPVYDESVPKARLYGRYLTHVWVWIETLSLTIRDSMCGFRLYPLALACELIDGVRLPMRMDFDIEILVRLHWRRAAFRSIATRVTYAADGVSHFDVLWDNVRISRSHTRLVFGMLWRLPMLLAHKVMPRRAALAEQPRESNEPSGRRGAREHGGLSELGGLSGMGGPSGPSGPSGLSGVSGLNGLSGLSGLSGPSEQSRPSEPREHGEQSEQSKADQLNRLGRRAEPSGEHWWRIAERGSHLGMALLALSCKLFGRRFTALWLHPVVAYFLLTGAAAREASADYFRHLRAAEPQGGTPRPGWLSAYRHMLAFAQSGFDKLAAWSGRVDDADVKFEDRSEFEALVSSGKGALVIGAHLGNLEMTRALAAHGAHAKVTAVVYTGHARRFNRVLASASSEFTRHLLEVADFGPDTAMLMQQRVDAGELLVIVGDRVPAHEAGRTTDAQFLGASAPFAQGPYVLAHALGCPVYLFFCLKERDGYHLYFEPFAERIELPRRERAQHLAAWAQRYAARLEHYCRKAPYQWFNFFDFWAGKKRGANGRT